MLKAKAALAAVAIVGLSAGLASATDIAAKKIKIRSADPAKQKVQVQSKDPAISLPTTPNKPNVAGASLHVYGTAINECFGLDNNDWEDKGTQFKYKDAAKNSAQVKDDKLKVKMKGAFGIGGSPFGTVNAIFRAGTGYTLCMQCSGASITKDEDGKYNAKDCAATPCDPEAPPCPALSPSGAFLDLD